ncbi:hypothetical protein MC52_019935 [Klebsiella michiganensis]|nr:hypothetical protein C2U44_19255 [Klebsiella oxytoca]PNO44638.1 hypothetical protein MC52_019935 [Klebsiella michiganensis]POT81921.1 hypothetical protein C3417_32110 [Klebsiella oxytoca]POV45962.1 hypothetical protein C3409_31675 [Klebsiella oxytoca]
MLFCWLRSFTPVTYLSKFLGINERLLPLTGGQPRLVKFVPDEFVSLLPPQSNSKSIGYRNRRLALPEKCAILGK